MSASTRGRIYIDASRVVRQTADGAGRLVAVPKELTIRSRLRKNYGSA